MPKISIIIVSWNVKDLLIKCLDSINIVRSKMPLEVFVVDNDSHDNTAESIKQNFSWVKLIASDKNLGFAKANNLAIKQATGDYILLLNPDTEIFTDTLERCLSFVASHADCGVMGCKMVYPNGQDQPSIRRLPNFWPILLMLLKLPKVFPNLKTIKNYLAEDFDYTKTQPVEQVMGAFMFMPKSAIEKVGLLDERFFVWFEEVDFCRRVWQAGLKVYYLADAKIIHHGGKSFSQQKIITNQRRFFISAAKYFLKNGFKKPASEL